MRKDCSNCLWGQTILLSYPHQHCCDKLKRYNTNPEYPEPLFDCPGWEGEVLDVSQAKLLPMGFVLEVEVDAESTCPFSRPERGVDDYAPDDAYLCCSMLHDVCVGTCSHDCPLSKGAVLVKRREASDV